MKPIKQLAQTHSREGEPIELVSHDGCFQIRSGGIMLFNSRAVDAERALGQIATGPFLRCRNPRILIGGLGLGYTVKSALRALEQRRCEVTVAEPSADIAEWHRSHLSQLHGRPPILSDPRLSIRNEAVEEVIWKGEEQHSIVIHCLGSPAQEPACRSATLAAAQQVLRPGGLLCVLAPIRDRTFDKALRQCGFEVSTKPLETCSKARRPKLASLWMARKA